MRAFSIALCALILSGCATPPINKPQRQPVPTAWRSASVVDGAKAAPSERWWEVLRDPILGNLIAQALAANADLAIAGSRVAQARAATANARAERWPSVFTSASAQRQRQPEQRFQGFQGRVPAIVLDQFHTDFQASYELDWLERVAKGAYSAQAEEIATAQDARSAQLAIVSAVVSAYADLRLAEAQLRSAQVRASASKALSASEQRRLVAGVDTQRSVREVSDAVTDAALARTRAEQHLGQAHARLALLLGKAPAELILPPSQTDLFGPTPTVAADLPATVIERRPEVQAAWQRLLAATTDVERSQLERYPRITLTGATGFLSNALSTWLTGGALAWTLAARAEVPVFDAGRIQSRIAQARGLRAEREAQHRKAVLTALQEVETALTGLQAAHASVLNYRELLQRKIDEQTALNREMSAGRSDRPRLLRAELAVAQARDDLASAQHARMLAFSAVQQALGR